MKDVSNNIEFNKPYDRDENGAPFFTYEQRGDVYVILFKQNGKLCEFYDNEEDCVATYPNEVQAYVELDELYRAWEDWAIMDYDRNQQEGG